MRIAILSLCCFQIACSTSGVKVETGKSAVGGKDACTLLTLGDVQELYGADMKPSDRNRAASGPGADVSTCTYSDEAVATLVVTWGKGPGNSFADRDGYLETLMAQVPKELRGSLQSEKTEFQGIPAIWQGGLGQLLIFKNGAMATLNADAVPGKSKRQTIEALMVKVSARL